MNYGHILAVMRADHPGVVRTMTILGKEAKVGAATYNKSVTTVTFPVQFPRGMTPGFIKVPMSIEEDLESYRDCDVYLAKALAKLPSVKRLMTDCRKRGGVYPHSNTPYANSLQKALDAVGPSGANLFDKFRRAVDEERRSGRYVQVAQQRKREKALADIRRAALKAKRFGASSQDVKLAASVVDVMDVMGA